MYPYPPPPPPRPGSGAATAVVVLLWVFVGWPTSWVLLALEPPLGILFGLAITVGLIVFLARSGRRPVSPPVVVPPPVPVAPSPYQRVRREIEDLARVDAVGGCGWCGSASAHRTDEGYLVAPRHWHATEIEERVRAKLAE